MASNRTDLLARGFASIYGEWETTGEAETEASGERDPRGGAPARAARRPFQLRLRKRRARPELSREIWSVVIDTRLRASSIAPRGLRAALGTVMDIQIEGASVDQGGPGRAGRWLRRRRGCEKFRTPTPAGLIGRDVRGRSRSSLAASGTSTCGRFDSPSASCGDLEARGPACFRDSPLGARYNTLRLGALRADARRPSLA